MAQTPLRRDRLTALHLPLSVNCYDELRAYFEMKSISADPALSEEAGKKLHACYHAVFVLTSPFLYKHVHCMAIFLTSN